MFWSCPKGGQALWRHLRTINKILVPDDRIPNNDGQSGKPVKYENVLFRHWDPNVLGSFLPLLNSGQFARIFGPATAIVMDATEYGGLKYAPRPDDLPKAPRGPLRIEPEQIKGLSERRLELSRRKVMSYLREVDPDTANLSDIELRHRILEYEASGDNIGLQSERAHMKWAYIMSITDGQANHSQDVKDAFRHSKKHPDETIDDLLDALDAAWTGGRAA